MIVSPLYLMLPRKRSSAKRFALNLNQYRNLNFHILNQIKKQYKKEMHSQIVGMRSLCWPVKISYRYFLRQRCDVGNVHSVVEKFFLDALVELGRIPDDNVQFVIGGNYTFAGFDRKNPRCEIEILENYQL